MVNIESVAVVYVPDYRSPPSGLGTISVRGEKNILIQDLGCNPIVDEDVYDEVLCIDYDLCEDVRKGYEALIDILLEHEVEYVRDSEMRYEMSADSSYFPADRYINVLRSNLSEYDYGVR